MDEKQELIRNLGKLKGLVVTFISNFPHVVKPVGKSHSYNAWFIDVTELIEEYKVHVDFIESCQQWSAWVEEDYVVFHDELKFAVIKAIVNGNKL